MKIRVLVVQISYSTECTYSNGLILLQMRNHYKYLAKHALNDFSHRLIHIINYVLTLTVDLALCHVRIELFNNVKLVIIN